MTQQNFEVPVEFRELMEKSVEQARTALERNPINLYRIRRH